MTAALNLAVVPAPATATTPAAAARAWTIAANSSSYRDPQPGAWTLRAAPFVTGAEAAAERRQRAGGGGSTWAQIITDRCAMTLHAETARLDPDTDPSGSAALVNVSATSVLTCATGTVDLSPFDARLLVVRRGTRWYVAHADY